MMGAESRCWIGALGAAALTLTGCEIGTVVTNSVGKVISPVITVPVQDAEAIPDTELPLYGKWCGPGYPPPERMDTAVTRPPIDALDSACMKHDLCLQAHGNRMACRCNDELMLRVKYLQYHAPDMNDEARSTMFLIRSWFTSAPCTEIDLDTQQR